MPPVPGIEVVHLNPEAVESGLGGPGSVVAGFWPLPPARTRQRASLHRGRLLVVAGDADSNYWLPAPANGDTLISNRPRSG